MRSKIKSFLNKKIQKPSQKTALIFIGFVLTLTLGVGIGVYSRPILEVADSVRTGKPIVNDIDLSSLQSTYKAIVKNYDGKIDNQKLIDAANKGMVESLGDDYTVYLTPDEVKTFNNELKGYVGAGIGVEIGKRFDKKMVLRVLADHPAVKAGILKGDFIVKVNGESTEDLTVEQTAVKIRGEAGSTVNVTVLRNGKLLDFNITRAAIDNKSVDSSVIDGVGIIRISRFDMDTGDLARKAAQDLKNQNVKGIILDLRNNGGGYVEAAQAVAGIWLDHKIIMTEKSGDKVVDQVKSIGNPILEGMKTAVLINGSSASASEIIAGAFQDYKIATIVGEQSYGKGSVQELIDLDNGAQLKVTIARWFTPNDVNITKSGIKPDTSITYSDQDANNDIDTQQIEAIRFINT